MFNYIPVYNVSEEGYWDKSKEEPIWIQNHIELVKEALSVWVGDSIVLYHHLEDIKKKQPLPSSGSGKIARMRAEALLWEIKNESKLNSFVLYRGSHEYPTGLQSFSSNLKVAQKWADKNNGFIYVAPKKTVRGLRLTDYGKNTFGEREWIVDCSTSTENFDMIKPIKEEQILIFKSSNVPIKEGLRVNYLLEKEGDFPDNASVLKGDFNLSVIKNRRWMFNSKLNEFVLGMIKPIIKSGLKDSHAEEFEYAKARGRYDDCLRGWFGFGGEYKNGIVHFAPPISQEELKDYDIFDGVLKTVRFFLKHGCNQKTILRGLGYYNNEETIEKTFPELFNSSIQEDSNEPVFPPTLDEVYRKNLRNKLKGTLGSYDSSDGTYNIYIPKDKVSDAGEDVDKLLKNIIVSNFLKEAEKHGYRLKEKDFNYPNFSLSFQIGSPSVLKQRLTNKVMAR